MFGGIFFGQYWPEGQAVSAGAQLGGDYVESGAKKRKKKVEEPDIWPQPWQHKKPPEKQKPVVASPVPVETGPEPAPVRPIAVVLPAAAGSIAKSLSPEIRITDPAIAAKAAAMRARLRRDLEDEEILMIMGFFD